MVLVLTIFATIVFWFHPKIDLQLAQHFYLTNNRFSFYQIAWASDARRIQYGLLYIGGIILALLLVFKFIQPKLKIRLKSLIYLVFVFALVPGVLVNAVLKNHFHRPRPVQVQQFAGDYQFKRIFTTTGECPTNCSFVCGDAAAMFAFWCFLPFIRHRWKMAYGTLVTLLGAFYGYIRMGQGGHFFSDVIFSALLSYLAIWLIHWYFYRYNPKWLQQDRLEKFAARFHNN